MSTSSEFAIARLNTLQAIRKLAPEWVQLWQTQPDATPFQRPEWLLPWIESFRPDDLWVLEVRHHGTLAGIAPLFSYKSESRERVLAILGAGISDYLDFVIAPSRAKEVTEAIFGFLQNAEADWDRVELLDLGKDSALLSPATATMWPTETAEHDVCPRLILPPGADQLRQVITSRQHRNLRTAMNRIRRAGAVQITLADRKTLSEHLEALFHLHATRWREAGKPGVLASRLVKEFHDRGAPLLLEAGVLRLYALRLNSDPIATLYTLWGPQAVYLYLQGFDLAYAEFSPGMQIIAVAVEDALREGKRVIDFLRGPETYKYAWGARDEATFRRILRRRKGRELTIRREDPLRLVS